MVFDLVGCYVPVWFCRARGQWIACGNKGSVEGLALWLGLGNRIRESAGVRALQIWRNLVTLFSRTAWDRNRVLVMEMGA